MDRAPANPTQKDLVALYRAAYTVCSKYYNTTDPDYESAINHGVYLALKRHDPDRPKRRTLENLAVLYALQRCEKVESQHHQWWKQDQAGALRGKETSTMKEDLSDPPLSDFEFLSFVAAHGRTKAAKLLGMRRTKVISILDEVVFRLKNRE